MSDLVESSFGKEENLHQQILASFPLCDLVENDLTQNPQFCKLLTTLSQHLDETGLTVSLKKELEKAEQKLQTQRRNWLRSEVLYRGLQEMIQECCVRQHHDTLSLDQKQLCETVERSLLVARCVRHLDLSNTTEQDGPNILGLDRQQVMELMPSEGEVRRMKQDLPKELEKHLKKKCLTLLCYHQPECEGDSEGVKISRVPHLSAQLEKDKKKAETLTETCQHTRVLLQRQMHLYLSELLKCTQILQDLILDHRLKIQTDLEKKKLEYLEGKCELVLQKITSEMVEVQLETYSSDTISAHRKIRGQLESELKSYQEEKQSVEQKLASFEILGKEFEALAEEYYRLQREIEMKKWALKELG
ncbi:HAUS augmin-like complex subunit 4 [Neosynchiropus ocellatus]